MSENFIAPIPVLDQQMLALLYATYVTLVTPMMDRGNKENTPFVVLKHSQQTQSIGTVCDAREPHNYFMKGAP